LLIPPTRVSVTVTSSVHTDPSVAETVALTIYSAASVPGPIIASVSANQIVEKVQIQPVAPIKRSAIKACED
jgi:hypothetical protein